MKVSVWSENQFVDATSVGGLNAAFNLASGSISSMGSGVWAAPGLLLPESMGLAFSGMVGTVSLPAPWGVVSTNGVVVRAHGTQSGQDTNTYTVNFSSLVPTTGTVTAILAASIATIQQDAFPLTGPPQGHPSYNPNFVPSVAYATTAYSVALTAVTGAVDNVTLFELARTTLTAGQVAISSYSPVGWQRAAPYVPTPAKYLSGGSLTLAQAAALVLPISTGLTHTLPAAASGGGLSYRLVNPSASTNWTVAAGTGNTIAGAGGTPAASLAVPPYGSVTVWGNAASNQWEVTGINPLMMAALPNVFTQPQTIVDSSIAALTLSGSGTSGANLKLTGNGGTTPSKYIRTINGRFQVINSLYTAVLLDMDDAGNAILAGSLNAASAAIVGAATVGNGLTVQAGGIYSQNFDSGGLQLRTALGTGPGAGWRNDGASLYLLMSNPGAPTGGFNGLRPLTINLTTGAMTIDGTGVGVVFGGLISAPSINFGAGTVGGVTFPGGGVISAPGAITSASSIFGNTLGSTGNITSNAGRLRAALGAFNSVDGNAATLLSDFPLNLSSVGWTRLPNGLILQWGAQPIVADNLTHAITLSVAFSSFFLAVVPGFGAFTPVAGITLGAQTISLSQFDVIIAATTNIGQSFGVWWLAVGF